MSGIAGIFHLDGRPVDVRLLAAMSTAIAHRGPDGAGLWHDGPVGLAHRMLHSTPEAVQETQPWCDESGQLVLVLDGRIDNREELKIAIEAAGVRLRDATDAELVLKSYECWAEDCPKHLLGDFAFAVWDARRRRLFCARDPLGNKPLFYRHQGDTFAFASEMQPLFADPDFSRRLNLPLVGMFLLNHYGDFEETLYERVLRLPAGHTLCAAQQGLIKQRYWNADPRREICYRSDAEYAEHFLDLFRRSIRNCLRANGPVGAELSGGLDSSSIVCTAASLYREGSIPGKGPVTLSLHFGNLPCDESEYIREVVQKWELESWRWDHDADPTLTDLQRAADYPDVFYEPVGLMLVPALKAMQQRGMRVLLQGLGGDELMAPGFGHLTDLMVRGRWASLMRQLRADAICYEKSAYQLFLDYCLRPLVPKPVKAALRPLANSFRPQRPGVVSPAFLRAHHLEHRLRSEIPRPRFFTRSQQGVYDAIFYQWGALAAEMSAFCCSWHGVECRLPFRELKLLEFLLAVPADQRWRDRQPKFVLRQAMAGLLPEKILQRRDKAGFDVVIDQVVGERQAQALEDLFRNSILVKLGIADQAGLDRLLHQYRTDKTGLTMRVLFVIQVEWSCRWAQLGIVHEQEAL